jgi:sugar phosphate isomerase/epimerase
MRLAFPALGRPDLDLPGLIGLVAPEQLGLELHASRDPRSAVATNLLFTDAAKIRSMLADAGVALAAVWAKVPVAPASVVSDELARFIEATATAGGSIVRLIETRPTPTAILQRAAPIATAAGVRLTLDNLPVRNGVLDLWRRLDAVDDPAVGCRLDTAHAGVGGDGPSLAIPTLARWITLVRLSHAATDAESAHRLAGIGFTGWLSIDAPDAATTVLDWLPKTPAK